MTEAAAQSNAGAQGGDGAQAGSAGAQAGDGAQAGADGAAGDGVEADPRDAKIAELTQVTQDLAAKLDDAIGQLGAQSQQQQRTAEDKLRAVGKHDEIIASRDGTIAEQAKLIESLRAGSAARDQAAREQAVLEQVLEGVDSQKARSLLHGVYLVESAKGWDPAKPITEGGDVQAAKRREAIKAIHPDLFGTGARTPGTLPPPRAAPGGNHPFQPGTYGNKPRP